MLVLSIPVKPNNMRQQQQELLLYEIFVSTSACKGGTIIYIIGISLVHQSTPVPLRYACSIHPANQAIL
jgi:hypothetical protein